VAGAVEASARRPAVIGFLFGRLGRLVDGATAEQENFIEPSEEEAA